LAGEARAVTTTGYELLGLAQVVAALCGARAIVSTTAAKNAFLKSCRGSTSTVFCNEDRRQLVEPQPYDATVWPGGLAPGGLRNVYEA
jgi:hypothetical protein